MEMMKWTLAAKRILKKPVGSAAGWTTRPLPNLSVSRGRGRRCRALPPLLSSLLSMGLLQMCWGIIHLLPPLPMSRLLFF